MATEILMPALSPTMEEGTLAKWVVQEGDEVQSGDIIAEIETDKATMEFEAVDEGVIGKILIPEGREGVKVNTPIAVLLEDGETEADIALASTSSTAAIAEEIEVKAPEKANPSTKIATPIPKGARVFASPLAKRIAADNGLDISIISGSGPRGRVVKADVEHAVATGATATIAGPYSGAKKVQKLAETKPKGASADIIARMYEGREFEEMPLDGMRKTIAARLTEAKQTIPHFYLRRDIQLDALLSFRSELNAQLQSRGVKLSVNDFIIKACALALQSVPNANAVWAEDRILKLKPSDVAVAVAIEGGLFTPVLQDADQKSLSSLSAEMKDLAARARERKLAPHEYQGGSFAISNLGMFGITNFDAVINPPHGAILAVGAGIKKPVVTENGDIDVATVMSVTLSVDHRVIDGALGAELLEHIVSNLENPMTMLV
ncbi:pyruvate dehydrogenase complex dihydrolipoamide acetyltransferase [Shimia abyssi]|uniref:Acetyltransferase component of pyruvate dehydrogenase complex n=1 Tax=Shimia abyssi TaxID=1662395 RepID=A0A2P8FFU4_9RHOB|nr:pyruvate dehydrogenase complex dihydrolipoamide acetyltransferase [Shimia abyssi]PSL20587.1 pyruvate dehydrogenase E2 component (dihydrolipoamide acetyltransferase) [Shimia abyssi]